jgi:hypothetical protein
MLVRLVGPPKLAGVHGYRWTVSRLTSAVPPGACLGARGFGLAAEAAKPALDQLKKACWAANLLPLWKSCILSEPRSSLTQNRHRKVRGRGPQQK